MNALRMTSIAALICWSQFLGLVVSPARAQTGKFQELLQAARKEAARGDVFLVYASNPREEKTRQVLFDAFKKRFQMDFRYDWLSLFPTPAVARIISEVNANRKGPSIFMGSVRATLDLDHAGLLETFDWLSAFGSEFPDIKEPAVDRVPMEMKGKWIAGYDGTRSLVYNTNLVKPSEVPNNFDGLVNPKWSRRFAMSGGAGVASPFDLFSLVWGEQKTLDVLEKLLTNKPIFKNNVPPVINAVAAGEAAIGLGSIHETERLKTKHAPVEWKTYGDYIPVVALGYALTKTSPHPNLGRLFLAWFVTDGMKIFEEMEFSSRITLKNSKLSQLLKEQAPNAKVLEPINLQQLDAFEAFSDKVTKIVSTSAMSR
jgi:iron(III) transport system substrate-binding protein